MSTFPASLESMLGRHLEGQAQHAACARLGQNWALRWAVGALLATAKKFRRIMGYRQLWMLQAHLEQKKG